MNISSSIACYSANHSHTFTTCNLIVQVGGFGMILVHILWSDTAIAILYHQKRLVETLGKPFLRSGLRLMMKTKFKVQSGECKRGLPLGNKRAR